MPPDKGAMGVLRVKLLNGAAARIHYGVKEFAVYDKGSQAAIITLGLPKARTMVRWGLTVGLYPQEFGCVVRESGGAI